LTVFPLKVGPTGRYLVDQNGLPFLGLGDSGWEIITTLDTTDANTYLADRQSKGFNLIPVELIDNQYNFGNTVSASTWGPNSNGDFPFTTKQGGGTYNNAQTQSPDFSTPNAAWWTAADARLNLISSYGFTILLYPFWLGNPIGDPGTEGYYNALNAQSSAIRQGYGAFVANRYGPSGTNPIKNLIWGIGGDNNASNGSGITAINNDIVAGIQSVTNAYLFYVDGLDGTSMINLWGGDSFFGCNGIYSDELLGNNWMYQQCKSEYQNTSGLKSSYPQFMKEGAYEGEHSSTNQFIRSQNWQAMLGGCWGYCWGNHLIWQFASGWPGQLNSVGTQGAQVVNGFFNRRNDWYKLVPDWSNVFLTNGGSYSNATFASAARTSSGSWGAIYTPGNQSLTVSLAGFSNSVQAVWVDPTNGTTALAGTFPNSGSHTFAATPGTNASGDADWVLALSAITSTTFFGSD
jgi:hypothetical protein